MEEKWRGRRRGERSEAGHEQTRAGMQTVREGTGLEAGGIGAALGIGDKSGSSVGLGGTAGSFGLEDQSGGRGGIRMLERITGARVG